MQNNHLKTFLLIKKLIEMQKNGQGRLRTARDALGRRETL